MQVIETKERKVTVMSAKPNDLPATYPTPKPQPQITNATSGPSYNDAFAMFLKVQTRTPTPVPLLPHQALVPPPQALALPPQAATPTINPTQVSAKVIVQPAPIKIPSIAQKPAEPKVSVVQQKQEDWTNQVLMQSQQMLPHQRVMTERIQPYVSGQAPVYAIQPNMRNDSASQIYYTIHNNPNQPQQQGMRINGQGYEHNQQFY